MIRTIFIPNKNSLTLSLPDDFLGKQIEVIAFVIGESRTKPIAFKNIRTFSSVQLDTKGFRFNRDEANER